MCKRNARVKKLVRQETRVQFAMNQQMLANPMVIKGNNNNNNKKEEKREILLKILPVSPLHLVGYEK